MKMVPLFRVGDMPAAVDFYTRILDFELAPWDSPGDPVVSLFRGEAELMLTGLPTDQAANVNAHLIVGDADALFALWSERGLDQSHRVESPVHLGPVDQSWGTREFYVTDPFGNTLRVVQRPAAIPETQ
jgi:catechol 2,3-dioxygenase-like lactoylglutathione lyase family enzyme